MLYSLKIKLSFILLLSISFLFISCDKDDEKDNGEDNNPPVASSIYLKTIIKDIDEFIFTYDSLNRITKFEYGEVNGPVAGYSVFEYTQNQLTLISLFSMGKNTGKMIFKNHNSLGLPKKAVIYFDYGEGNGFELSQTYNYYYDGDKLKKAQLIEELDGAEIIKYEKLYFYEDNNMVKQENYYTDNDSLIMFSFFEYSFDNGLNPGINMGLPQIDFLGLNYDDFFIFPSISTMNKNNFTSRKEYDINGDLRDDFSINRSLEYYSNSYIYKSSTTNIENSFSSNSNYIYL